MDFDLNRLEDIVSPYYILLKKSNIEYVTNALVSMMGLVKDEIIRVLNKDPSLLENIDPNQRRIQLPTKNNKTLECMYTSSVFDETQLIAFSNQEQSEWTMLSDGDAAIFTNMVNHSDHGCVIIEKGHVVYANKRLIELLNYSREMVLSRQFIGFVTKDFREGFIKACEEGAKNQDRKIACREIMLTTNSGRRINTSMKGGWTKKGNKDYLWLMLADITEKKLVQRQIKDEQLKFIDLYERSPVGILNISPRGIILDCNEFVCNLMGYSKEELRNKPFDKFVAPHEVETLENDFKKLFVSGADILRHECLLKTKQGDSITVEYSAQSVKRRGHYTKALMLITDITEKKVLEGELLDKNAEMEKTLWEMAEVKDALEARAGELNRATEELKLLNEKLNLLSITDGLTEIYNHRHFQDRLTEEVERVHRNKDGVIALLILDIDDFKKFNDTYGHQCGDMVLRQLASILKSNVRTIDILARYGGEEFAVILPNANAREALKVAERICESTRSTPFTFGDGTSVKVTVSIGVGVLLHGQGEKSELIQKADNALYAAKSKWKDRVEVWEED